MRRAIIQAIIIGILAVTLVFPLSNMQAAAGPGQAQQAPASVQQQGQITVNSQLVNVDAVVTDGNGNFVPNLKKENFRILEDGKPQIISNFTPAGEAPITIVLMVEFRANIYTGNWYSGLGLYWSSYFLNNIKKNDWIALEDFDLKMRVDVDFTHDPREIVEGLRQLTVPMFSESCLYDALTETIDRLHDVKGKKAILVVASGFDTFSKHTWDSTQKELKKTDVSIYTIGTSQFMVDLRGGIGGINTQMAQNIMKNIAEMTGGQGWTPEFDGQIPEIMQTVAASLRNQYSLGYAPPSQDGKYHKIKIELVTPEGAPLPFVDQKGKKVKMVVYARQGYTAPNGPNGD
jgi:VWFA-related protein